jgi:signal transduction histidine kinase
LEPLRNWPLHRLLIACLVALALGVGLPIAAFNAFDTRTTLRTLTEERLRHRAALTATRIDERLRGLERWASEMERQQRARWLIRAGDPANPDRAAWEQDMLPVLRNAEELDGILIARRDGVRLAETGTVNVPDHLDRWAPFQRAVRGESQVVPRGLGTPAAQYLVLTPVGTEDGTGAVIILADDLPSLLAIIHADNADLDPGAFGALTDEHGVRIVQDGQKLLEGVPTRPLDPAVAAALRADERLRDAATVEAWERDDRLEGVRTGLASAPWSYAISMPEEHFRAPARMQLVRVAVGSLAALVLGVAAALLIARRLARPFEVLEGVIDGWAQGARGSRAPAFATREARRLGEAFNEMAVAIESYERSLQDQVAERTAQLEAAHRELELFTYSASHDLRAPLRAIDGFTAMLVEDEADALSPDGRDLLRRTSDTVQRMAALIDKLLAFGRVSRHAVTRERVDLSALAREVAAELRSADPGLRCRFEIADGLVATADPALLRVVLENLIGNACKYSRDRAEPRIEVGRTTDPPAFLVRDNGAGFDMRDADRLFAPFQRLHAPDRFPGTGVGLATVQRIIERHGGRIWAWSEPDRGATFYFTLPSGDGEG